MADDLKMAIVSATSALKAQSTRIRVVTENLANAAVTSTQPGGDPYVRKTITFAQEIDRSRGAMTVRVAAIGHDTKPFRVEYEPSHPAANSEGFVKHSNVNPLIELADIREAHRTYEANLQVVRQVREIVGDLIDLMKGR